MCAERIIGELFPLVESPQNVEGACFWIYKKCKASFKVSNKEKIHKENKLRCCFRKTESQMHKVTPSRRCRRVIIRIHRRGRH